VLVSDLINLLDRLAPLSLAQPGDNCGLLVGSSSAPVEYILVALELTQAVLAEAEERGCDTILTHHPLLYAPLRSLTESDPREQLVRRLIRGDKNLLAWHTNLDAAPKGLAALCAEALGLRNLVPLERAAAGWYKLVVFIPPDAVPGVSAAVFAAGAGRIGDYRECAYALQGTGWFTPEPQAHPTVGSASVPERTPEVRWETVVPRARVGTVITALVEAHPYEEPAFDIYPVEDVIPRAGLGRIGELPEPQEVTALVHTVVERFGLTECRWVAGAKTRVQRVAVLPGSGRSLLAAAAGLADVLITGDLGYHDGEAAAASGLALITVPHGEVEWWALRQWAVDQLRPLVAEQGSTLVLSASYRPLWQGSSLPSPDRAKAGKGAPARVRLRVDGGSRGNPGPSAIGVVLEDAEGKVLDTLSQAIGVATNNVAEYRALLAGLRMAQAAGVQEVDVMADSELLVKQMRGEYQVKNAGLRPLYEEAAALARGFRRFCIEHVSREKNAAADELVNAALDSISNPGSDRPAITGLEKTFGSDGDTFAT